MKFLTLVFAAAGLAGSASAHDNVAEICTKSAAIVAPVSESAERINLGLTAIRLSNDTIAREGAAEIHALYSDMIRNVGAAMKEVADLCEKGS